MGCASALGSPPPRPHARGEGPQQSPIQPDLRWGTHNFPGQHGPVSHQPHHKKCLLMSNLNLPFLFKPIVPYPVVEALERSLSLSCLYFSFIYWSPLYTDSSNITINADNILLFSLMLSPVDNNSTSQFYRDQVQGLLLSSIVLHFYVKYRRFTYQKWIGKSLPWEKIC